MSLTYRLSVNDLAGGVVLSSLFSCSLLIGVEQETRRELVQRRDMLQKQMDKIQEAVRNNLVKT